MAHLKNTMSVLNVFDILYLNSVTAYSDNPVRFKIILPKYEIELDLGMQIFSYPAKADVINKLLITVA